MSLTLFSDFFSSGKILKNQETYMCHKDSFYVNLGNWCEIVIFWKNDVHGRDCDNLDLNMYGSPMWWF